MSVIVARDSAVVATLMNLSRTLLRVPAKLLLHPRIIGDTNDGVAFHSGMQTYLNMHGPEVIKLR